MRRPPDHRRTPSSSRPQSARQFVSFDPVVLPRVDENTRQGAPFVHVCLSQAAELHPSVGCSSGSRDLAARRRSGGARQRQCGYRCPYCCKRSHSAKAYTTTRAPATSGPGLSCYASMRKFYCATGGSCSFAGSPATADSTAPPAWSPVPLDSLAVGSGPGAGASDCAGSGSLVGTGWSAGCSAAAGSPSTAGSLDSPAGVAASAGSTPVSLELGVAPSPGSAACSTAAAFAASAG
jgi:hypothetical protein